jgi:alkylation response protein AidB-like acyl-CoA dehydrogenase
VVLPPETVRALREIHGSGLWRPELDERARYAAVYLLNLNGEMGVSCSVACTDGLWRVLRLLGTDARSREVLHRLEHATPEAWLHGAQLVTEIQGGSDAATNALRAVPREGGLHELTGEKWFCSNITADHWLITARVPDAPAGHRGIGLFCVPRVWNGEANGHVLLRLKDKLGTRALPTAEISFAGALGWAVGPLDAGLKNMVAVVLTTSRVHNVVAAAAMTRRAVREAAAYASFREAFGRRLEEHPLLAASLARLRARADRAEAGAFGTVDVWTRSMARPEDASSARWSRILVSIAKAVATRQAPAAIYEAMMVLGGNGIEERFSPLPRLWRDSAILETWEGPYTLLLMQALGDLVRLGVPGHEEAFLEHALGAPADPAMVEELADILRSPDEPSSIERWRRTAHAIYDRFEALSLTRLGGQSHA